VEEKVKNLNKLIPIVKRLKKQGKKVGLIVGCFDIIHKDHIELFRSAKKKVDILIVGVERDASVRSFKGPSRPLFKLSDRLKVLSAVRSVDYLCRIGLSNVSLGEKRTYYKKLFEKISPTYIISNRFEDRYWKYKCEDARSLNIKTYSVNQKGAISTTKLISKLIN